jgi:2-amino-4-hydroxy-6-hydroxymethyldihydropteridine diphosphokinase
MPDHGLAYIALGSNIGERERFLADARKAIGSLPSTSLVGSTPIEETEPLGDAAQGRFLNQMVAVRTGLEPLRLLEELQAIEARAGRQRMIRWGPRTLDLDIVHMEGVTLDEARLTVPHPELPNRDFWKRELEFLQSGAR